MMNLKAKTIAAAIAVALTSAVVPAMAQDMQALLELLRAKGVITQAEFDQHSKTAADAAENKAFIEKRVDADVAKANKYVETRGMDGSVTSNGLGIKSADGNFTANLTGRMHLDARSFDSDFTKGKEGLIAGVKGGDAFELRRARLGIAGTIYKDIDYLLLMNMTGTSATANVEEAFANYKFSPAVQVRMGRFKQPFNMEEVATSSNNLDFMQRSYVNALAPAKQLGFMVHGVPMNGTTYAASAYQTGFDQISAKGSFESAARITANFAELASIKDTVLHAGIAATNGKYEVAGASTASTLLTLRDESRGVDFFKWTEAGVATNTILVDKTNFGAELAGAYGPFKVQYEYSDAKLGGTNTSNNADLGAGKIKTQYLVAMYNITGESWADTYKNGGFGGTKPKSIFNLSNGGIGAWQVGMRLSKFDASDLQLVNATSAGLSTSTINPKGQTMTYGLNWMLNSNARMMLNYAITKFDSEFTPVGGGNAGKEEKVISLRSQFNF